jgi:serine/threonine-protein kinase
LKEETMNGARWQKVQELFEGALTVGPDEREKLLKESGAEAEMLEIVAKMLRADTVGGSVLDRGVPEVAYELLVQPTGAPAQPPMEEFGPYRTIRLLGEGGMGVVWLAERTDTGSQVAIKFLLNAGLSPARLERFTHEVRLLARLKHPSIARFYDAGTLTDGTPWFVMEYVEGTAFGSYAKRLDLIEKRLRLFRSVCEAVQYAHGQAIVHRDLKPSNILVESDGTPKLLDFGIARELQQTEDQTGLTVRGPRFMSPHYSAPEWIKDAEAGVTTDVYSLGVMLYEILTGRLPCDETSRGDNGPIDKPSLAARKQSATEPESGSKNAGISRSEWNDLDVLCLKAMHMEPAQRYGSVEALIRDIDHFMHGEPLEARPDSWSYRSAKFLRRNARAVTATAAALLLMAIMAITFTVRLAQARNAALAEAARSNRVQQFTLSLFKSSGNLTDAPGNLTVETLVDRGAVEVAKLSQEPALQADLDQNLGQMYQDIGKLDKADRLDAEALTKWDSLGNGSVESAAESRIRLGLLRADENRAKEGEQLVREAVNLLAQKAPKNRQLRARANASLGQVQVSEGNYAPGAELLKQAAADQEAAGASMTDWAETLTAYADAELYLGHYDESDAVNRRLLAIYMSQLSANDPHIADALQNLAETAEQRGNYSQAEDFERQALAIAKAWYGKEHSETADKMTTLANTLVYEKKYAEANQLLQSALAIQEKVYGKQSSQLAYVLNALGMTYSMEGDHNSAIKVINDEIEIYTKSYGTGDYRVGVAIANQGTEYFQMKRFSEAEKAFRNAVAIQLTARGENNADTAVVRIKLGRTLLMEHRYREAEENTRAGYEALRTQTSGRTSFVQAAQEDLVTIYDALRRPRDAQTIRDEIASDQREQPKSHQAR